MCARGPRWQCVTVGVRQGEDDDAVSSLLDRLDDEIGLVLAKPGGGLRHARRYLALTRTGNRFTPCTKLLRT